MIPVGDFLRRRTTPYVNWALIAINFAVFIYMLTLDTTSSRFTLSEADHFLIDWGFIPRCVAHYFGHDTTASVVGPVISCPSGDRVPLQLFTSMFVHAGWAHILGNMLFLWIFGDNVEDQVGHGRYLVFYLFCGLAASATQTFVSPATDVPTVGASGAIAGVLGAYFVMFPGAMVQVIIFPLFFLPFFVPAVVLIGIWFVMQVFSGVGELGNATAGSGVAFWAHVGGFIAGVALIWLFRKRQRLRVAA